VTCPGSAARVFSKSGFLIPPAYLDRSKVEIYNSFVAASGSTDQEALDALGRRHLRREEAVALRLQVCADARVNFFD